MKLGRVVFNLAYTVDLENPEMIAQAQNCLYEDIMNAMKYDELHAYIDTIEAEGLSESDIPEFLRQDSEERNEMEAPNS